MVDPEIPEVETVLSQSGVAESPLGRRLSRTLIEPFWQRDAQSTI